MCKVWHGFQARSVLKNYVMYVEKAHKAGSMLMQRPEKVNFNPDYTFAE
jgi:hypothetical protein